MNIGLPMFAVLILTGCGTIKGVVKDKPTGKPVANATVSVGETSDVTNSQGQFKLKGIFRRGDALTATAPGYSSYTETIKRKRGIIDIELTPGN